MGIHAFRPRPMRRCSRPAPDYGGQPGRPRPHPSGSTSSQMPLSRAWTTVSRIGSSTRGAATAPPWAPTSFPPPRASPPTPSNRPATRPRAPPDGGQCPSASIARLAHRRHTHDLTVGFGHEPRPRHHGSTPLLLRSVLLVLPGGTKCVGRILQSRQPHVTEDLPLVAAQVPDFSFRVRTPSAPS